MFTSDITQNILLGLIACLAASWAVTLYACHQWRQAFKQQQAKEQRVQNFMASLSHHLRTPLNGIMGYAEYIHTSSQEPMVHFTSKIILENSVEMLHLVNDMLDMNKIKENQLRLTLSAFDVYDLLESVRQLHQARATRLNIQLHIHTNQRTTLKMNADPYRLRQVLNNLVDNAITYNRPQGEVSLQLMHDEANDRMTFAVEDTGLGITRDAQAQLFNDQTMPATEFPTKGNAGIGLGLPLSRHLVRLMGGTLDYHTEVGVGSRFYFTLPIQSDAKVSA